MQSTYDNPQLQQARTQAQGAQQTANAAATADMTLPDMLREALTKKFSTNNPIVAQREGALQNYLNTTTQAPLDVAPQSVGGNAPVVFNPLQQANLIQQKRSAALAPLASLNDLFGLQTGGLENTIGVASRAHQAETQGLQQNAQLARQNYEDILTELSKKAEEANQQNQLALEAQRIATEYGFNSLPPELMSAIATGQSVPGTGLPGAGGQDSRSILQQIYSATPNLKLKENIANSYKTAHGQDLFPSPPTGQDLTTVMGSRDALSKIDEAMSLLEKVPTGGIQGNISNFRLQHPGLNSLLPFKPSPDAQKLYDALLSLRSLGERSQVGGRLSGYMLNALGTQFPTLVKDKQTLQNELSTMKQLAQQDLNTIAQSKGYSDFTQMPGYNNTQVTKPTPSFQPY